MKSRHPIFLANTIGVLSFTISASYAVPEKDMTVGSVGRTTDRDGVPTCTKKSSTNERDGKAKMRKQCVFTCTKEDGLWGCRGDGKQCNAKSPWN